MNNNNNDNDSIFDNANNDNNNTNNNRNIASGPGRWGKHTRGRHMICRVKGSKNVKTESGSKLIGLTCTVNHLLSIVGSGWAGAHETYTGVDGAT